MTFFFSPPVRSFVRPSLSFVLRLPLSLIRVNEVQEAESFHLLDIEQVQFNIDVPLAQQDTYFNGSFVRAESLSPIGLHAIAFVMHM